MTLHLQSHLYGIVQRIRQGELEGVRPIRVECDGLRVSATRRIGRQRGDDGGPVDGGDELDLEPYRLRLLFRLDEDVAAAGTALRLL